MKNGALKGILASLAVAVSLAACGAREPSTTEPPTLSFTQAAPWTVTASGAVSEKRGAELFTLTPSTTVVGYQTRSPVPTGGRTTLVLRYDVTLQGGPGALGVLADDDSRWHTNTRLPAEERSTGEVRVQVEGDQVHLVLQTTRDSDPNTIFTVHDLSYRLE